jgi:23S rRNA (cytosine1962-C5)-methyltransferase
LNKSITLKKNEDRRILSGHLWAFSNEIETIEGDPHIGDIVELKSYAGKFLGIGFYNPHSLITFRLLSRHEAAINESVFFQRRIANALALRRTLYPDAETFRVVHGESDFLPGLIVDKYNDYLSIQTFSAGIDIRLPLICDILEELFHPKGIVERNEAPMRKLESLEQRKGILRGSVEPVTISENGIKYLVDLLEGQKTGFFLDQRENRKSFRRYVKNANVLDVCCNDGGFALNAAYEQARQVTAIDISETALSRAHQNAMLNNLNGQIRFEAGDMFDYLRQCDEQHQQFDVINLDPPAFTKNRKSARKAMRGYKDLHTRAFKIIKPGGILTTASCSYHVSEMTFLDIINTSAQQVGRSISLLEWHGAAPDHPTLPAMPETKYLKFGVFRVE